MDSPPRGQDSDSSGSMPVYVQPVIQGEKSGLYCYRNTQSFLDLVLFLIVSAINPTWSKQIFNKIIKKLDILGI